MFPSFDILFIRNHSIFDVKTYNGLSITQSIPISPFIVSYSANILPPNPKTFNPQNIQVQKDTRNFSFSISYPKPHFQIILDSGTYLTGKINFTPKPWISMSTLINEVNRAASISIANYYSNLTLVMNSQTNDQPQFFNIFDASNPPIKKRFINHFNAYLSGGTEKLYISSHFSNAFDASDSLLKTIIIGHSHSNASAQCILSRINNQLGSTIKLQKQTKVSIQKTESPLDIGLLLSMSTDRYHHFSFFSTVAWKLEVNDCVIHSSIETTGIVKSSFTTKPNKSSEISITGKLDHTNNFYTLGIGMKFV